MVGVWDFRKVGGLGLGGGLVTIFGWGVVGNSKGWYQEFFDEEKLGDDRF